jgi:SET domain-containing protein
MYPMKPTRTKDRAVHHANGTASKSADSTESAKGRRIQVRRSGVHGRGVYALRKIKKGETIIEYKGEMITWKQAERRHPHNPDDPDHTFFFHIDEEHVIDAAVDGNAARWINHACDPNCESDVDEDNHRVFIKALRKIRPGEELFYDYGLVLDERYTPKVKKQFACRCGARDCRGTMLAPKR